MGRTGDATSTGRDSTGRPAGRPALVLVLALVFGGVAPVLVDAGVRDAVDQRRIETAGRCATPAATDCILLVRGLLDGPVSGGRGYLTWAIESELAGDVRIDLSTYDTDDVEQIAPELVTFALWNGDVVWIDSSLGRMPDTFRTYASAVVSLLLGLAIGCCALMLARVAIGVRRRTGSWWAAAGPADRVDETGDTAGRVVLWLMTLSLTGALAVGFSTSLWGLLVPVVGTGLYLWHRAAQASTETR